LSALRFGASDRLAPSDEELHRRPRDGDEESGFVEAC